VIIFHFYSACLLHWFSGEIWVQRITLWLLSLIILLSSLWLLCYLCRTSALIIYQCSWISLYLGILSAQDLNKLRLELWSGRKRLRGIKENRNQGAVKLFLRFILIVMLTWVQMSKIFFIWSLEVCILCSSWMWYRGSITSSCKFCSMINVVI